MKLPGSPPGKRLFLYRVLNLSVPSIEATAQVRVSCNDPDPRSLRKLSHRISLSI